MDERKDPGLTDSADDNNKMEFEFLRNIALFGNREVVMAAPYVPPPPDLAGVPKNIKVECDIGEELTYPAFGCLFFIITIALFVKGYGRIPSEVFYVLAAVSLFFLFSRSFIDNYYVINPAERKIYVQKSVIFKTTRQFLAGEDIYAISMKYCGRKDSKAFYKPVLVKKADGVIVDFGAERAFAVAGAEAGQDHNSYARGLAAVLRCSYIELSEKYPYLYIVRENNGEIKPYFYRYIESGERVRRDYGGEFRTLRVGKSLDETFNDGSQTAPGGDRQTNERYRELWDARLKVSGALLQDPSASRTGLEALEYKGHIYEELKLTARGPEMMEFSRPYSEEKMQGLFFSFFGLVFLTVCAVGLLFGGFGGSFLTKARIASGILLIGCGIDAMARYLSPREKSGRLTRPWFILWHFFDNASLGPVSFIFILAGSTVFWGKVPPPGLGSLIGVMAGAAMLAVGLVMYWQSTDRIVFDRGSGLYWKGIGDPSGGGFKEIFEKHDIAGVTSLQILYEAGRHSLRYQLNAVFIDSTRNNILFHDDIQKLRNDARALSEFLGAPLWDLS